MSDLPLEKACLDVSPYFPDSLEYRHTIDEETIVPIARVITEYIHEAKPDAIVAADRGGRLLALAVFGSWHYRYPGDWFPTTDGKIHFARITNGNSDEHNRSLIKHTLITAGIPPVSELTTEADDYIPPKIMLLDDWVHRGETFQVFAKSVTQDFGIPKNNILLGTMCGRKLTLCGGRHVVGDTDGYAYGSRWDDGSANLGIQYYYANTGLDFLAEYIVAQADISEQSVEARQQLYGAIEDYYDEFTQALAREEIAPCTCHIHRTEFNEANDSTPMDAHQSSRWLGFVHKISQIGIKPHI